jgi:hypothetical protein
MCNLFQVHVLGLGAIGLFWGNSDGLVVQVHGDVKLVKGRASWECAVCKACKGKEVMGM